MWSPYNGAQQGDPVKLGQALVKIAGKENAPQVFVAGSDALAAVTPAIEERLQETRAHEELSKSNGWRILGGDDVRCFHDASDHGASAITLLITDIPALAKVVALAAARA